MCFVSACEGDERERTGERGSEGAEGERNIFSTVGGRTREGVRAVLRCQHRAAGTGSHPLHFDAAHWGTDNNFGLQKENGSSFLRPLSLSLPHPFVFSDYMLKGISLLYISMIICLFCVSGP